MHAHAEHGNDQAINFSFGMKWLVKIELQIALSLELPAFAPMA